MTKLVGVNMIRHTYDVAIIGAGVAGASMAGALADRGWKTVLIDKSALPRHKVCGEFLSPESREYLTGLGLYTLLKSLGPRELKRVSLTSSDGFSLEIPLPGTALGISRYTFDNALLQHAQMTGTTVCTGMKVTRVHTQEQQYRVEVRDKYGHHTITARAVIGAWGRAPSFRLKNSSRPQSQQPWIGIKAHFEGVETQPAVELYFFPGGYLGVSPVEDNRTNVSALLPRKLFQSSGKSVLGAIKTIIRLNPRLARRLANAIPIPGTETAVVTLQPSWKPVAWGVVPHIGDAAAVIPPLCGDGMAMALRSAELCMGLTDRFLRGEISLGDWCLQYTSMLHREFAYPLRWGNVAENLLTNAPLSSLLFRLGKFSPKLANRIVRETRLGGSGSFLKRDIRLDL